jgi:hypothetical protein
MFRYTGNIPLTYPEIVTGDGVLVAHPGMTLDFDPGDGKWMPEESGKPAAFTIDFSPAAAGEDTDGGK